MENAAEQARLEREKDNSLAGQMSAVVNQARYKRQVEELKEKDELQKEEFAKQVKDYLAQIGEAESKMMAMLQDNEAQLKKAE